MNAIEREKEFTEDDYADYLDEVLGDIEVGNLTFQASLIIRELDPIAFRCGMSDVELDPEWECGECGEVFETEEDAEECCSEIDDSED